MLIWDPASRPAVDPGVRQLLRGLAEAGVDLLQVRAPALLGGRLYEQARSAREALDATPAFLVVNDRLDIAVAVGAAGVHLAWRSLPVGAARRVAAELGAPASFRVGVSVHDRDGAVAAAAEGADYLVFGPVWDTPSKRGILAPRGPEQLAAVCAAVPVPVLAVGGVRVDRVPTALAAGASGVAVSAAILGAPDPLAAAAALRRALDAGPSAAGC